MIKKIIILLLSIYILICYAQNRAFTQNDTSVISKRSSSEGRKIHPIDNSWTISYDDEESWESIQTPFLLDDTKKVILKNDFIVNLNQSSNLFYLVIKGVIGLKEIFINETKINYDLLELEQFKIPIPGKLIKENTTNYIKLVLSSDYQYYKNHLSSTLLRSLKKTGIYDDIYIISTPAIVINDVQLKSTPLNTLNSFSLNFNCDIIHTNPKISNEVFDYLIKISINKGTNSVQTYQQSFQIKSGSNLLLNFSFPVNNVELWSPTSPNLYNITVSLTQNNSVIDEYKFNYGFKTLKFSNNTFTLNGNPFLLNGVTYFENNGPKNLIFSQNELKRDLNLIKSLGANSIFIINSHPREKLIEECDRLGLLVFFELDDRIFTKDELLNSSFIVHQKSKLEKVLSLFSNNVSFSALKLGELNSPEMADYFSTLHKTLKKINPNILDFISLEKVFLSQQNICDFYGLDFYNTDTTKIISQISEAKKSNLNFIISELGYIHSYGINDGYEDKYSMQAQAKYLAEVINIVNRHNINYFIHSFADYRTNYQSIISGKLDNTLLCFGLVNEYRDQKKNSFYTVKSFFSDEKLPIITQGNYSDKKNIIFIISGLITIAFFVILINSTRRLREYALRALTRTYNFFSDVRDQRVFSIFHTTILGLVLSASVSLLFTSLLFYFKDDLVFEQFVSVLNSKLIFAIVSYLAWRPLEALLILTIFIFIKILIIAFIIKMFNIFVKSKIYYSHSYIITVWSFLPFILSIPLGIVLFKFLTFNDYNLYLYLLILFFILWTLSRLFKGISILFEVRLFNVYLSGLLFIVIFILAVLIYYQSTNQTLDYILYFLNQI